MQSTQEEYRLALIERQIVEAEERMAKLLNSMPKYGQEGLNTDHPEILLDDMELEALYISRLFILESWCEKHTPALLP